MTKTTLEARTAVELKAKIRKAMGWPDRRSFTAEERALVGQRFRFAIDFERGVFTATEKVKSDD